MRLIDADTMMIRLKAWNTNDATDKALYNFALNRVLEAPTVEPERKKGKWIDVDPHGDSGLAFICSKCREINLRETNFCPNCGADMRKAKFDGEKEQT